MSSAWQPERGHKQNPFRWSGGSSTRCSQQSMEKQLSIYRGGLWSILDELLLTLIWRSTNLKPSQYDLHCHCDFDNKMKLTEISSLTIFASAWNSYLSRGNNLFEGITWDNICDFAHSFIKLFFLQLVSALEAKDENASPQAGLSVLKRNFNVFNGCLKGRNMNEIEENVSQTKT